MQDHRKLEVWHDAQDLATHVHAATIRLRGPGVASLCGQLRRAAASVGANIAEGAGYSTQQQFAHFLQVAIASASETESHLDLMRRQKLLPPETLDTLTAHVIRVRRRTIALRKRVVGTFTDTPPTTRR